MKSSFRFNSLARCLTIITVHPWVWLLQLTLDMWKVDRGGLELMSLWVRSGVLRIAKNSCRSNSARYPLFNTLDNSMPIDFNDFLINVQKNLKAFCFTEYVERLFLFQKKQLRKHLLNGCIHSKADQSSVESMEVKFYISGSGAGGRGRRRVRMKRREKWWEED